jgi:hypothetical protein
VGPGQRRLKLNAHIDGCPIADRLFASERESERDAAPRARRVGHHEFVSSGLGLMWVGVAMMFIGFAARWTDRTFGLAQVLQPELFEWVGTWAMRVGLVIAAVGGLVWAIESVS